MIIADNQLAVVMARGASTRMGKPKGLCRINEQGDAFVTRVARLYNEAGIPVLLIVRPEDFAEYEKAPTGPMTELFAAPGGGDTALTMKLAMDWVSSRGFSPELYWAHPVDLPLVQPQTITALGEAAANDGDSAWRPFYGNTPGHPVLIPAQLLANLLKADPADATMSGIWKKAMARGIVKAMRPLAVDDPGTTMDFDTPEHLQSMNEPKD